MTPRPMATRARARSSRRSAMRRCRWPCSAYRLSCTLSAPVNAGCHRLSWVCRARPMAVSLSDPASTAVCRRAGWFEGFQTGAVPCRPSRGGLTRPRIRAASVPWPRLRGLLPPLRGDPAVRPWLALCARWRGGLTRERTSREGSLGPPLARGRGARFFPAARSRLNSSRACRSPSLSVPQPSRTLASFGLALGRRFSEKGVRSAHTMQVGPRIPVGILR